MKSTPLAETSKAPELRIVRRLTAAPGAVFDALTNPESMQKWWGENTTIHTDLRVGGHWTIVRKEGDTTYTATGEYLEIEQPHRLKYTYAMPQFSPNSDTISIEITPDGAGCVIAFAQTGEDIANELRELPPGTASASEAGWQQGFDLISAAWEKPA